MDRHYMFTYGMNTDPDHMRFNSLSRPIGKAHLVGWQLEFRYYANIVPGGEMDGVLWEIDDATLAHLDSREGYPDLYKRFVVNVTHETETYGANVYSMTDAYRKFEQSTMPSPHYLETIRRGYTQFKIDHKQLTSALAAAQSN